ncbi:hypothetical protein JOC94_001924 [Bacillus thermophilus]|uniref:Uncharacterized protein n=1 Tax=Siminovitchia thermophila TaxID=1245522 RepID=A0ABS2R5M5_9BACI|nr:hypothetical protein [Siminovitchia thermophila]
MLLLVRWDYLSSIQGSYFKKVHFVDALIKALSREHRCLDKELSPCRRLWLCYSRFYVNVKCREEHRIQVRKIGGSKNNQEEENNSFSSA